MIQILGSSHIFALYFGVRDSTRGRYAFKNLGDFCPGSRIVLPIDGDLDEGHLRPDLREWLEKELDAATLLALTIGGSDWLSYCISNRPEKFDVILPAHPELAEVDGARLVPYVEMKSKMRADIRHIVLGMRLIREAVAVPIVYLEPPPPIGDNEQIRATARFDFERIEAHGVTDPVLRRKLYLLHSELLAEACADIAIPFIKVPAHAMTADGFLPREGYKDDWMHANASWGAVMLEHVDREIGAIL